jgi:tRNA(Ile)-lysidine synthase TilS/MesJ
MLRIKEKPLYRNYEKQIESGAKNMDLTIFEAESENSKTSKLIQIDIGNSIYVVSGRINQIQRLFDANILRDWNEALLQNERKECGECEEIPEKTVKKIQNIT